MRKKPNPPPQRVASPHCVTEITFPFQGSGGEGGVTQYHEAAISINQSINQFPDRNNQPYSVERLGIYLTGTRYLDNLPETRDWVSCFPGTVVCGFLPRHSQRTCIPLIFCGGGGCGWYEGGMEGCGLRGGMWCGCRIGGCRGHRLKLQ